MTVDNEDNLWHRFKVEGDLDAREALILKYTGLVKYVINRLGINPPSTVDFGAQDLSSLEPLFETCYLRHKNHFQHPVSGFQIFL